MDNKCFYCPATTSQRIKLEKHHVFGRVNSDMVVYACLNCHNQITQVQNCINPKYRSKKATISERYRYGNLSLYGHLKRLAEEGIKQELEFFQNGNNISEGISRKRKSRKK